MPTKVCLVKAMVFPVAMYGCESWTVKKAEQWKIDAFELWCWRRLFRVPWTARRSNQSILKEISPGCSLEGLMLKLKLQYFGHLMWRVDSLGKTLILGGTGGRRRRAWQRMRWLDGITDSGAWVWVNSRIWWWTGRPGVLQFMGSQRVRHDWETELNWTEIGREHSSAHQQKTGLKIYSAWPHPSEQDPVFPSVSLSQQEGSISLLSFSIRGQTDWKPQSQKTNQSNHMDHSLV